MHRFHLDAPAWFREPSAPELLPELARAVWSDRAVELAYARPGRDGTPARRVTRLLEPYGLVLKAGVWYVVGRVPGERPDRDGAWRTYRVDRVTALAPAPGADEPFARDPSFDLAAYWQTHSAGFARALLRATVTVRLTERGLRLLPTVADPAGLGEALASATAPDAAGRVTLDLPVESQDVASTQLAALGADVEVLAPQGLRARIREHARALAAVYGVEPEDQR